MDDDSRPDCRYGSLCYQKNPEHHAKFKHSFKRKERTSDVESESKKFKPVTTPKRLSDSKSPKKQQDSKSPVTPPSRNKPKTGLSLKLESPRKTPNKPEPSSPLNTNSELDEEEANQAKSPSKINSSIDNERKCTRQLDGKTSQQDSENDLEEEEETNEYKTNLDGSTEEKDKSTHTEDEAESDKTRKSDIAKTFNTSFNKILIDDVSGMKKLVEEKYLVQMPDELFKFWNLCRKLSPKNPTDAFKSLDLKLVGPFDILNGQSVSDGLMITHWRHFYDPPEFQSIIISTSSPGLHFGYFRDSHDQDPVFIASNNNKDCTITPVASNLFTFIHEQFNTKKTNAKLKSNDSPSKQKVSSLQQKVVDFAHSLKIDLESPKLSTVVRARKAKTVSKGLSGVGVVVPYVKKTQLGYRPLAKSNKEIATLFHQYKDPTVDSAGRLMLKSTLQEVCTWVTIAMDESDFGTGLEFGLDLFGSGIEELHPMVLDTLEVAYQFLNRYEFSDIIKAHLQNRQRPYVNLLQAT